MGIASRNDGDFSTWSAFIRPQYFPPCFSVFKQKIKVLEEAEGGRLSVRNCIELKRGTSHAFVASYNVSFLLFQCPVCRRHLVLHKRSELVHHVKSHREKSENRL